MGCGCRGGLRRASSRGSRGRTGSPAIRSRQKSTCARLENLGNSLSVHIGPSGRIFLGAPLGSGVGLPVTSLLPSLGCTGSFATALKAAEVKLLAVFLSPKKRDKFRELIPHKVVKLSYLRSVLRLF